MAQETVCPVNIHLYNFVCGFIIVDSSISCEWKANICCDGVALGPTSFGVFLFLFMVVWLLCEEYNDIGTYLYLSWGEKEYPSTARILGLTTHPTVDP